MTDERRPEPESGTEGLEPEPFQNDIPGDPPAGDVTEVVPDPNFVPIPVPEPATDEDSDQ